MQALTPLQPELFKLYLSGADLYAPLSRGLIESIMTKGASPMQDAMYDHVMRAFRPMVPGDRNLRDLTHVMLALKFNGAPIVTAEPRRLRPPQAQLF